jgi:hypothetical protein
MEERAETGARAPNDVGGLPAPPLDLAERPVLPWEKRMHALLNVLDQKRILRMEEKRRAVEQLGRETYDRLSYYERWILAACNLGIEKGLVTAAELAGKLEEVAQREAEGGREVLP